MELCAQATVEQDPVKLMELVREIHNLLEEKERRLGGCLTTDRSAMMAVEFGSCGWLAYGSRLGITATRE